MTRHSFRKILNFSVTLCVCAFFQSESLAQHNRQSKQFYSQNLVCQHGKKQFNVRPIQSDSTLAYDADFSSREILYFPTTAFQLPEAISKLQFARSCLILLERLPEDEFLQICEMVRYLRFQNSFDRDDAIEAEDYYLKQTETDINAYSIIKAINQCYTS